MKLLSFYRAFFNQPLRSSVTPFLFTPEMIIRRVVSYQFRSCRNGMTILCSRWDTPFETWSSKEWFIIPWRNPWEITCFISSLFMLMKKSRSFNVQSFPSSSFSTSYSNCIRLTPFLTSVPLSFRVKTGLICVPFILHGQLLYLHLSTPHQSTACPPSSRHGGGLSSRPSEWPTITNICITKGLRVDSAQMFARLLFLLPHHHHHHLRSSSTTVAYQDTTARGQIV